MRKVIFRYWIPAQKHEGSFGCKPGTGCFSEEISGFFHCWGVDAQESEQGNVSWTVAIVESVDTGHIWKVPPERIRFVQPPETRVHKNEAAKVEIINIENLSKATLSVLLPVLENINKKLQSL